MKRLLFLLACLPLLAFTANAQTPAATPQMILPTAAKPARIAGESTMFCAIYPLSTIWRNSRSSARKKNRNKGRIPQAISSI